MITCTAIVRHPHERKARKCGRQADHRNALGAPRCRLHKKGGILPLVALLVLAACGQMPAGELEPGGVGPVAETAAAAAACVAVPEARCYCCWPAKYHGPGRCRFARSSCAPADPCESDPEQQCPPGTQP